MQPLFGSPRLILVLIELQSSPSSPAPRHRGWGDWRELVHPHKGTFWAASWHLLLSPCWTKHVGGNVEPPLVEDTARKVIYSSKILLCLFPHQISLSNACGKSPPHQEGSWTCQQPREGHGTLTATPATHQWLRGFFLQFKLLRDELAPSLIKIWQLPSLKSRRREAETVPSTDAPIGLLKSMMNCCSPAVGNSRLVLMHVGTRQRKKSTKHLMSKASALALSPGSTIPVTTAPCTQVTAQAVPEQDGSSQRPAQLQQTRCQIPLSSSKPQLRSHSCRHLLACSWKHVGCSLAALGEAGELSQPSLTLRLG